VLGHGHSSQERDLREGLAQPPFNELLAAHIQIQLDVVCRSRIHLFGTFEVASEDGSHGPGGIGRSSQRSAEFRFVHL
jgi:hypothetical protein